MAPSIAPRGRISFAIAILSHSFALLSVATKVQSGPASQATPDTSPVVGARIPFPYDNSQAPIHVLPSPPFTTAAASVPFVSTTNNILRDVHDALSTMQDEYFSLWIGKWTKAIDWTAAVANTYVSATLSSLSKSIVYTMPGTFDKSNKLDVEAQMVKNEINKYFGQNSAFYYGEDAFGIRMEAYDDILWVVLEWLESIQFIEAHSNSHYASAKLDRGGWHGKQFIPAFAHRARIFYEVAERGWDRRLCGGGLTWNPRLLPYKNAITNELFISASISMYLNFPGDDNCSPLLSAHDPKLRHEDDDTGCGDNSMARNRYDVIFLANAKNGYDWLKNSGMINDQGLYTDGFHIAGYRQNHSKTTCDERNDMVYTYNQGVLLSGLRGLWEATDNITYLEHGHELVRNVIRATGWNAERSSFAEPAYISDNKWHGLGSDGILMEACDPAGTCNQDGQMFKGIFFHHLTAFCTPLPVSPVQPGKTFGARNELRFLHKTSCDSYAEWVIHNAQAALGTKDKHGKFGAWWGAGRKRGARKDVADDEDDFLVVDLPKGAIDYRNDPSALSKLDIDPDSADMMTEDLDDHVVTRNMRPWEAGRPLHGPDPNTRGRGRTVETQAGGLSVVRAMLEFVRRSEDPV